MLAADPIVSVDTNVGNFKLDLFQSTAPNTVANFLKYVDSGDYNSSFVTRAIPGFVIQGGGATTSSTTFAGGSSQFSAVPDLGTVASEAGTKNTTGTIAMALSSGPNTGTNQWFINLAANSSLDGTSNGGPFTVFGDVVGNGMQVINQIAALPTQSVTSTVPSVDLSNLPVSTSNQLVVINSMSVDSIDGTVFADSNGNGIQDSGEAGVAGRTVFINKDGTGVPDANNPSTTTDANGNYSFSGLAAGTFTVQEVLPAGKTLTTPTQTVTVAADQTASGVNFGEATAVVPAGSIAATAATFAATEGTAFSGTVATFSDPVSTDTAAQFTAAVNWGDGTTSTAGTVSGSAGAFTVAAGHTYGEDGALPVSVTISEVSPGTATATASSTADIASAGLTLTAVSVSATEGHTVAGTMATFTDASATDTAGQFTATVNWGDGSSSTGTVSGSAGAFTVAGAHTYADEGGFTVSVQVTDTQSAPAFTASASASATVADADALSGAGTTLTATAGQTFNGVVATFTNANAASAASDFTATINWGDGGSSTGTVSGSGTTLTVSGSHTYAAAGSDSVSATLADDAPGTATATATSTAQVANSPLSATAVNVTVPQGMAAINVTVATFTDANASAPASDFTATVNWGDGSGAGQQASVTGANGAFTVTASHTYGDPGRFTLAVSIQDTAGAAATVSPAAVIGGGNQRFVAQLYRDLLAREAEPQGFGYWTNLLGQGQARSQIVAGFEGSFEFRNDVAQELYSQYLGRPADPAGLANISAALISHTIEQQAETLISSAEYFNNHGGGTAGGFLTALYSDVLHRAIDPAAQARFSALNLTDPAVRAQVAAQVFGSGEYETDLLNFPGHTAQTYNAGLPMGLYQAFLHRAADTAGLAAGMAQFKAGQTDLQVVNSIIASNEYFANL
ncbi:MAG TPA: peptidylprolyl isomerase [Pirellulales bacterium]|nr:peptidylprolyl isomerase [Pirellulales bacterium]